MRNHSQLIISKKNRSQYFPTKTIRGRPTKSAIYLSMINDNFLKPEKPRGPGKNQRYYQKRLNPNKRNKNFRIKHSSSPRKRVEKKDALLGGKLASNMNRNQDLNLYERMNMGVHTQSIDYYRMVHNLPVGTDLYRFKVEQGREMDIARSEVTKIIDEQKLKDLKKRFEWKSREEDRIFENLVWADEQRKIMMSHQLRKNNQENKLQYHKFN